MQKEETSDEKKFLDYARRGEIKTLVKALAEDIYWFNILITRGEVDIINKILDERPHLINEKDKYASTPLMWAASKGNPAIVKLLLDRKIPANIRDVNARSENAVMLAANPDVLDILFTFSGKDLLSETDEDGETVITRLVVKEENNAKVMLEKILQQDVSNIINIANNSGDTALLKAVKKGSESMKHIVNILLENGAVDSLNIRDGEGKSVLELVVGQEIKLILSEYMIVVEEPKFLPEPGAVTQKLMRKIRERSYGNLEEVKEMLRQGASVKHREKKTGDLLGHIAVRARDLKVLEILLEQKNIKLDMLNFQQQSVLDLALETRDKGLTEISFAAFQVAQKSKQKTEFRYAAILNNAVASGFIPVVTWALEHLKPAQLIVESSGSCALRALLSLNDPNLIDAVITKMTSIDSSSAEMSKRILTEAIIGASIETVARVLKLKSLEVTVGHILSAISANRADVFQQLLKLKAKISGKPEEIVGKLLEIKRFDVLKKVMDDLNIPMSATIFCAAIEANITSLIDQGLSCHNISKSASIYLPGGETTPLHFAIDMLRHDVCEKLIALPEVVVTKISIEKALATQDIDIIKIILNSNKLKDNLDDVFMQAIELGRSDIILAFIDSGVNSGIKININGNSQMTPLIQACMQGSKSVVVTLLKMDNININKSVSKKCLDKKEEYRNLTALWIAAANGFYGIVKLLQAQPGIILDSPSSYNLYSEKPITASQIAKKNGHKKVLSVMNEEVELDIDIDMDKETEKQVKEEVQILKQEIKLLRIQYNQLQAHMLSQMQGQYMLLSKMAPMQSFLPEQKSEDTVAAELRP